MKKWTITLEFIRSQWVILITHGRSGVLGCATADDLQTAMSMAAELFEGCLEWPERDSEIDNIPLHPAQPIPEGEVQ